MGFEIDAESVIDENGHASKNVERSDGGEKRHSP